MDGVFITETTWEKLKLSCFIFTGSSSRTAKILTQPVRKEHNSGILYPQTEAVRIPRKKASSFPPLENAFTFVIAVTDSSSR